MSHAVRVAPRADGQPTILIMPRLSWPAVCERSCAHERCLLARQQAMKRCVNCDEHIAPGSEFIEHRDPTGHLVSQHHVECPMKGAA